AFLGENHFIDSEEFVQSDYNESDTAADLLPIRHDKRNILLFAIHSDSFERRSRNPGVFASRINQKPANNGGLAAIHDVLDFATGVEGTHVTSLPWKGCPCHYTDQAFDRSSFDRCLATSPRVSCRPTCSQALLQSRAARFRPSTTELLSPFLRCALRWRPALALP